MGRLESHLARIGDRSAGVGLTLKVAVLHCGARGLLKAIGEERRRAIARGRDIYAFSASLVCEVAERVLRKEFSDVGAHAPGAILNVHGILAALQPDYLRFEITAA